MENLHDENLNEEVIPEEIAIEQENKDSAPKKKELPLRQRIFKDVRDILIIIGVFMLIYTLCFRAVVVRGNSMYDTLCDGDRLLVLNRIFYRNPKQGDIIVASKDSFRNGECIIKRVIATEGQEVDIDFTTGTVYVNGVALKEPYLYSDTKRPEGMEFPLVVDKGCVFVMGDNRMDSKDSRDPEIGLIDEREIVGKVIFLLMPGRNAQGKIDYSRIGVID